MAESSTIIAALKFQSGVAIASDSQVSDLVARVRWPMEKLDRVGNHPLVIGFSGSVGRAQRARKNLEALNLHASQFKKRELVQSAIDKALKPIYDEIKNQVKVGAQQPDPVWDVILSGLAAIWASDAPQILELEMNEDSSFHEYFHAIGSASQTAYAIHRTLGGSRLISLTEQNAIWAILRILRTCVDVELAYVSEPLSVWIVARGGVRPLTQDEIQAHLQSVGTWEEQERSAFLNS